MANCDDFYLTGNFPTGGQLIATILQVQFWLKIKCWEGKITQPLTEVKTDNEYIFMHMMQYRDFKR